MIAAQAECTRCEKLFCYFQVTNARLYCERCKSITQRQENFVANQFNDLVNRCWTLMEIRRKNA